MLKQTCYLSDILVAVAVAVAVTVVVGKAPYCLGLLVYLFKLLLQLALS